MAAELALTSKLTEYMETAAEEREVPDTPPEGYEFFKDEDIDQDVLVEARTGCHVFNKPVMIRHSGKDVSYAILFFYCPLEVVKSLLAGKLPTKIPATFKTPEEFETCADIMRNFTVCDADEVNDKNAYYCVPLMVPTPLMDESMCEEGKDIWIVDMGSRDVSCLLALIQEEDFEGVTSMLKDTGGAELVNKQFHNGLNPLFLAASLGRYDVAKLLVDNKADATLKIHDMTVLMMLVIGYTKTKTDEKKMEKANYIKCIEFLKEAGCDATQQTESGDTALDIAKKLEADFLYAALS